MSEDECRYTFRPHREKGVEIVAEGPGCRDQVEKALKDAGLVTQKWFNSKIGYVEPKKGET